MSNVPMKYDAQEEEEFRKHLDHDNKMNYVTMNIVWDMGNKDIPTSMRFDKNLIDLSVVPDGMKAKGMNPDYEFCRAVWGNLQWESPDKIKSHMLQDINKYFNKNIKEIHIFGNGHIHEPDTMIITDLKENKTIAWIKFLKTVITDKVWKDVQESQAGKNSVIMK